MKLSTIITFSLLLLILPISLNASQLRIDAMSGQSPNGLYVTPDIWCDSFFVNPAYALDIDYKLLNIYSYFNIRPNIDDTSELDYDFIHIFSQEKVGMLIPFKYFTFGFDIDINLLYNDTNYEDGTITYHDYSLGSDILFAWEINDSLQLGINTHINTLLYNLYEYKPRKEYNYDGSNNKYKKQIDVTGKMDLGILVKKDTYTLAPEISFAVAYSKENPSQFYDAEADNWDKERDTLSTNTDLSITGNIFINQSIILRATGGFGIHVSRIDFLIPPTRGQSDTFFYDITIPIAGAVSFNHSINEKHLIFYGMDMKINVNYRYAPVDSFLHIDNQDDYDSLYWGYFSFYDGGADGLVNFDDSTRLDMGIGLFLGMELPIIQWLTVRAGLKTSLFTLVYMDQYLIDYTLFSNDSNMFNSNYDNGYSYSGHTFSFPFNTTISLGVAIMPLDNFTIELNSNFFISRISIRNESIEFTGYSEEHTINYRSFDFSFELGFEVKL